MRIIKSNKPEWLRVTYRSSEGFESMEGVLKKFGLNTVCEAAVCPNQLECYNNKTATFMILGRSCTRNCTFCAVEKTEPDPVDAKEPLNVAKAVRELNLKHVVITSVTRDDLRDGGASHYVEVIEQIRHMDKNVIIEVLIPDLEGNEQALQKIVKAKPHIINHNIETVPRLYKEVRPMAIYERSLELLKNIKWMDTDIVSKSGMMVGLGEKEAEVYEVLEALRENGCDLLTIGQYLPPSKKHHPLIEYVHPDVFKRYYDYGMALGFSHVASSPFVRSSYHAADAYKH